VNYLDLLALVIIVISGLTAIAKGLRAELASLVVVFLGLPVAMYSFHAPAFLFRSLGFHPEVSGFLGFVSVFLLFVVVGIAAGSIGGRYLPLPVAPQRERLLSGIAGCIRGFLINTAIVIAFTAFPVSPSLVGESSSSVVFATAGKVAVMIAPGKFRKRFELGYRLYYSSAPSSETDSTVLENGK